MAIALLAAALVPSASALYMRQAEQLLSWDEARQRAMQVLPQLSSSEKESLVHGSNSYGLGWYVGNTKPISHLNIPALTMQDAGNGFRPHMPGTHGSTTMWPSGLALAATWDESLVEEVGAAMGREFRGKGSNVMLGPSVNVHRIARNGRNFEYMSGEDPYLGARLVKPFVRGVQSEGVIATAKHYAFNEQETNRGTDGHQQASTSNVDSRTAWELYYPPFAAAVEAGVGAFMCSYNRVNGTHACENDAILNRDLKGIMGFKGFVMSDWGATHSTGAVAAGLDQDMPGGGDKFFRGTELMRSYSSATDEAVVRILSAIFHTRLHERPGCMPPACLQQMYVNVKTKASSDLARRAAARSIVLLKNEGALPLSSSIKTIAVLGAAATTGPSREITGVMPDYYAGGGSGHVSAKSVVTPFQGIKARAEQAGMAVNLSATDDPVKARPAVDSADAVIIVGATSATEGMDRMTLNLDGNVNALIDAVAPLKPTIVLMQTPGAVLTPWRHKVNAIANLFLGGEESGGAWASVLFGDEPPAGKLPIMMPATEHDVIEPEKTNAEYAEGLFTSYRSKTLKSAFPFGHGLSYTTFEYGEAERTACPTAACVSIPIKNTGSRDGVETVQAYIHFPPEANEPNLVLRGFQKSRLLTPGSSETVTFAFTERDLSVYSPSAGGWVRQSGAQVHVGSSSADIKRQVQL